MELDFLQRLVDSPVSVKLSNADKATLLPIAKLSPSAFGRAVSSLPWRKYCAKNVEDYHFLFERDGAAMRMDQIVQHLQSIATFNDLSVDVGLPAADADIQLAKE